MRDMQVGSMDVISLTTNILEMVFDGAMIFSREGQIIQANKTAKELVGFKECNFDNVLLSSFFANMDEYERIYKELQRQRTYDGSHVLVHTNGTRFQVKMKITEIQTTGTMLYLLIFDNQALRIREEAQRALSEKIFMNIEESVLYTDKHGVIVSVNPAFQIVTGYTEEEAIGERPSILQSGLHTKEFYDAMWKDIAEKGRWSGEIWNKRKNGEVFPEWLSIHAIVDGSGEVTHHVALFSDITDKKHKENQLHKLTRYDALTGTANRSLLHEELSTLMKTSQKYGQVLAVLHVGLDRFKVINETLGHEYGDLILKKVAARLNRMLKSKDVLARVGGDEFVIVLPNLKQVKEAVHISQEIISLLKQPFYLNEQEVYTSASIGISLYPFDGLQAEDMLVHAEKALNVSKSKGVNRFELYDEASHPGNDTRRIIIANKLHTAIENQELQIHYHPQVDLESGEIVGVEALLRWHEKELGQISPAEFIPIAEETGLIIPISQWLINKACEDVKNLHLSGYPNVKVSINISAVHFTQENFVRDVIGLIENTNINPYLVELELTESMIMPNAKDSVRKLVMLKQQGLKLSIDDFGTGYSSLSYLQKFPIDALKIDQSFIKNLSHYKEDSAIVVAIITMAKALHLEVIAEGVELKKHVDFLKEQKCDIIQGFYMSKPLPVSELQDFLEIWEPSLINGKKVHEG